MLIILVLFPPKDDSNDYADDVANDYADDAANDADNNAKVKVYHIDNLVNDADMHDADAEIEDDHRKTSKGWYSQNK